MGRLREAIRGNARDIVRTTLAMASKASEIIDTIELHYGNREQFVGR